MTSSLLSKKRTKIAFFEKISSEPPTTKRNRIASIANFEKFVKEKYEGKMREYSQALSSLDSRPIRLGLYFPLVPAWHEWSL